MGYSAGALPSSYPHSKVVDGAAANMRERQTHHFAVAGVEDHFIIRESGSQEVFTDCKTGNV